MESVQELETQAENLRERIKNSSGNMAKVRSLRSLLADVQAKIIRAKRMH